MAWPWCCSTSVCNLNEGLIPSTIFWVKQSQVHCCLAGWPLCASRFANLSTWAFSCFACPLSLSFSAASNWIVKHASNFCFLGSWHGCPNAPSIWSTLAASGILLGTLEMAGGWLDEVAGPLPASSEVGHMPLLVTDWLAALLSGLFFGSGLGRGLVGTARPIWSDSWPCSLSSWGAGSMFGSQWTLGLGLTYSSSQVASSSAADARYFWDTNWGQVNFYTVHAPFPHSFHSPKHGWIGTDRVQCSNNTTICSLFMLLGSSSCTTWSPELVGK